MSEECLSTKFWSGQSSIVAAMREEKSHEVRENPTVYLPVNFRMRSRAIAGASDIH
jgi:hypothetical protein